MKLSLPTMRPRSPETRGGGNRRLVGTRGRVRGSVAVALSLGLAISGLSGSVVTPPPAAAEPGTPGTPQPNVVVFSEGFENGPGTAPVLLTDYVGAGGQRYTADPGWLTGCNGQVVNFDIPASALGNCTSTTWTSVTRQLAWALGQHAGSPTPQTNDAVTAFTENSPGANAIQFRTVDNIPLASSSGRFLTFSVDTAAVNCGVSAPQYQFAFLNQSGVATNVGGLINACSSGQVVTAPANGTSGARDVNVGTYTSNGSVLFSGSTLGIQMRNANGSGTGNDAAFDNIRILDVTPQLDKAFVPATVTPNQASTLTFTVTNTAELSAKNGWSFTDALPAGLRVASPSGAATTCPAGTVTAPAGGTSITASGNLTAGMASCTVSVNVLGATAGTYTNGPDNVTPTGLDEPGVATLTVAPPVVSCDTDADLFNTGFNAATGGRQPVGSLDANWQISPQVVSTTLAAPAPPASTVWSPATVSGRSSTLWIESPYGNAEWISHAAGTAGGASAGLHNTTGYWYYRFQFTLAEAVDPASFALALDFYADNSVADIWVNGVSQGVDSGGTNPYYAGGFRAGGVASTTLDSDWVNGSNTIVVMTKSAPGAQGFLTQVRPSVLCPQSAITLAKTVSPATGTSAGDDITYSFLVTNTGDVTLTDVTVVEGGFTGTGDLSAIVCPAGAASLAPGASVTCTATYELTQADVDAGSVSNSATATGTPERGTPPVSPPSEVTVEIPPAPGLSVVKSAAPIESEMFVAGQEIDYTFVVTNTGNTTLTDVTVDEGTFTGTGDLSSITCPAGAASLAPGTQIVCTASYTLTQADVDAGSVTNSATATGTPPSGPPPVSPPSEVTIPTPPAPGISLVKSADSLLEAAAGDAVEYAFLVTNTGNVTLTAIEVTETEFSGTGELSAIDCPAGALIPGGQVTCTATYELTQADLDAGRLTNTAIASGIPASGVPPVSSPSSAILVLPPAPALTIAKSATPTTATAVGDVITYFFLVENTGNVTLADIGIVEGAFSGTGDLSAIECPAGANSLAPGETVTCVATYTLTQQDVDAGEVANSATATGTPPGDTPPPVSPPSEVTIEVPPAPSISVVKSASPATADEFTVGQVITYAFVVTNTGNVTLSDVTIDDSEFSGTGTLSPIACPTGAESLAPGAQITCTATYVLTQEDVDAGSVSNSATATGTPPWGPPPVSPPSEVTIPTPPVPAITLVKTSDAEGLTEVGQVVGYAFEVTNTGNVTLTDLDIDEVTFSGSGALSAIDCPAGPLLPGQLVACTASYEVTQADLDAGALTNTAIASGLAPDGTTRAVSAESTRTLPFVGQTALALTKSAVVVDVNGNGLTDPGDRIRWSFTVTNIGVATVSDIAVSDPTAGAIACRATILPPAASMDCSAVEDHIISAADARTGEVVNTATATGTGPGGTAVVSNEAMAAVTVVATPIPPLVVTGGVLAVGALVSALGALLAGALLLLSRRRVA